MPNKSKILLTGATGLVGGAILERLASVDNLEIMAVGGRKDFGDFDGNDRVKKRFLMDVTNDEELKVFETEGKIDLIIHSAGLAHQFTKVDRKRFFEVNVEGTKNICRLAKNAQVKKLILISSVSVYGDHGDLLVDENFRCLPEGDYAESKREAEIFASEFCRREKIDLVILRLGTVVGEGDRGNISRLITLIDAGYFFWVGDGRNKKSLIYKKDVAEACVRLLNVSGDANLEILNLTAKPLEMKRIVDAIFGSLKKKAPQFALPAGIFRFFGSLNRKTLGIEKMLGYEKTLLKWLSNDLYSGEKFRQKYDFEPATEIETAIERQVGQYLKEKNITGENTERGL